MSDLHERPAELLQRLIRFDTTNPPGAERQLVAWVDGELRALGIETRIVAADDERPNLVARLPGAGRAPALLLQGHADVVSTADQDWSVPPFEGRIEDGFVWGRGALDMKGGVAMMLAAFMRAKLAGAEPPGDVILALVSDEEAGGDAGAKLIVERHPELLEGARWALGEFGGFSTEVAGRRVYPVMVAEKQACWTRATVRGPGGHGSLPLRGGAMARTARFLRALDRRRLPVHVTPVVRDMIEAIAGEAPAPIALALRGLLRPALTDRLLDVMGEQGRSFDPLLHNTVNATTIRGGDKINVVPGRIELELDCRVLPGFGADDLVRELAPLAGEAVELEVFRFEPYPAEPDMSLFGTLAAVLRELDPGGAAVPLLMPAITDGRHFARLGIQPYGFLPMQLPKEMRFMDLIHAADERIPVAALAFGTDAIGRVIERCGEAA